MDTCSSDFCPSSAVGFFDDPSILSSVGLKLSALLVPLGLDGKSTDAVITNVSVIQSWRWFFHLSPFETIFLAFIIAEIGALSMIGILPININEYWQGKPAGRRKRNVLKSPSPTAPHVAQAQRSLGMKLLVLFKKLDQNECGFRALCGLQYKLSCCDYDKQKLSWSTRMVLMELLRLSKRSNVSEKDENGTGGFAGFDTNATEALQPFVEAVEIGSKICESENQTWAEEKSCPTGNGNATLSESIGSNSSVCERRYPYCPVTSEEIMDYVERINLLDYI